MTTVRESNLVVDAARTGDEAAFGTLAERYRRELQVHCYRMLGSFEDAEDLVQDTMLRAWRKRETYEGRATFRAWLYRIATNACLDFLDRHPRQPTTYTLPPAPDSDTSIAAPAEIPWLQPYPDHLLAIPAPDEAGPEATLVAKETIELAFMVAIQHLSPRQRAALILRDVLGWSANETAALLETSVAAVKSALQRARPVMETHLPVQRMDWTRPSNASADEQRLLRLYMDAHERADVSLLASLLREDVVMTMPPQSWWFAGRRSVTQFTASVFDPSSAHYHGVWRSVPVWANRQPATAHYVKLPNQDHYQAQVIDVLRVENGTIAEIICFVPQLFPAFGLPMTLFGE